MFPIFCLVHLSRYMPCLCVSRPSGFSSPTLRRPHLSSPPAYRICCLLTLVHLQSTRIPRRCPETGEKSTASGLSLKPITTNAVCSLGHRRRPNPLSYCGIGGTCVGRLVSPGTATLGRAAAEGRTGESGPISAGKTLLRSYPEARFRRERARVQKSILLASS